MNVNVSPVCMRTTHPVTSFENVIKCHRRCSHWLVVCPGPPVMVLMQLHTPSLPHLHIIYAIMLFLCFQSSFMRHICCVFVSIKFPFYVLCVSLQLLMDSQMNRRSFRRWPLTLQPMKWLLTWQNGTIRYFGVTPCKYELVKSGVQKHKEAI